MKLRGNLARVLALAHLPASLHRLSLIFWLFASLLPAFSHAGSLTLGVFAYRPKAIVEAQYQPLADYLTAELRETQVRLQVLDHDELAKSLASNQLDLLLTSPGPYLLLRSRNSLTGALATVISRQNGQATSNVGGVIIVAADRSDLNQLADLKGRRIATPGIKFLGGYQAQAFELLQAGVDLPERKQLLELGEHDAVVKAVLSGQADAGFIRTGLIEQLLKEGKLEVTRLRVINLQPQSGYPFQVSTRLYPEWPFVALPHVDQHKVRKIAAALLSLDADHPAALAAGIAGFAPPADYLPVETLTRTLRLPPFDAPRQVSLAELWLQYSYWIVAIISLTLLLVASVIWLIALNRRIAESRLRLAEFSRNFEAFLDQTTDFVYFKDINSRFVFCSKTLARITGHPRWQDMIGKHDLEVFPADTAQIYYEEERPVFSEGRPLIGKVDPYYDEQGKPGWVITNKWPLRDEQGRVAGIFGISRDITERMRQEQAQQKLAERLTEAQAIARIGNWHVKFGEDESQDVWSISEELRKLYGQEDDSTVSTGGGFAFMPPEDQDMTRRYWAAAKRGEGPGQLDHRIVVNGEIRWMHVSTHFSFDAQGKAIEAFGTNQDITERKTAEAELQHERDFAEGLIATAQTIVLVLDTQGRIVRFNPYLEKITGYSLAEVQGRDWFDIFLPEPDRARIRALFRSAVGDIRTRGNVNAILTKQGSERLIEWYDDTLKDVHGQVIGLLSIGQDITERVQFQQRLEGLLAEQKAMLNSDLIGFARVIDRVVQWVNPAFAALLGYEPEELAGKSTRFVYVSDEAYAAFGAAAYPVLQAGGVYRSQVKHVRKDGSHIWVDVSGTMLDSARGESLWGFIDITERKMAEARIAESEANLRAVIDNEPECIKIVDANGILTQMNPAGLAMIEADELKQVAGHPVLDVIAPEYRQAYLALHRRVIAGESAQLEYEVVGLRGGRRWLETHAVPMLNHGQVVHLAVTRDISERKRAEAKLHLAANVFSHAREGIMITEPDGRILDVNEAFTRITGYSREDVLGQNPRLLHSGRHGHEYYDSMWHSLLANGYWYGEIWNRRKNGEVFAAMQTVSAVRDAQGRTRQYVSLFSDITSIKEHERQLEYIAHYDALTSLPNRVLLADRLHQAMSQAQRHGKPLAVAYLDLDGFKAINDKYGHEAGDQLLVAVAQRMKEMLREGDTFARLGGDEFVAVLLELSSIEASSPLIARLLAAASHPVQIGELLLQVSASIGVSYFPQSEEVDADQLLRQADQAMYQAKLAGKNRYHLFDVVHDRNVRGHHESLEHIQRALAGNELLLYYQPKVNMRSGEVIGAEALIRWQHPQRGLLSPADFLPVIEEHVLAIDVGNWVIESALTQMEHWQEAGLYIPVSVNISAVHIQQPDFVERLRAQLARHPRLRHGCLEIEVLETSALGNIGQVSQIIQSCLDIGVGVSLDDFGTGYSSLTYLKRLPSTQLKVDQSFVRDMLDDPEDLAILDGVLGLATAFRRQVVAEGVETVAHGVMLLQLGCELAQGYGIAHPMPAEQLPGWVANWHTHAEWAGRRAVSRDDFPLLFAGVEHRAWIAAVEAYLCGQRETPPALDHQQCRFGCWLESDGRARHGGQAAFPAILTLHRQIHGLASEMIHQRREGSGTAAPVQQKELHELRDKLLVQLAHLLQAAA